MARSFHWSIGWRSFVSSPFTSIRLALVTAVCVAVAFGAMWFYERSWSALREKESELLISVVLNPMEDAASAYRAANTLRSVWPVAEVQVITPEMWQREFTQRYGVEISEVVPENPFSHTLRVRLIQGSINAESFMTVYRQCSTLLVVPDEVTYPSDVLRSVLEMQSSIVGRVSVVCVLCGLCILLLLSSALRSALYLTPDDLALFDFMGATKFFALRSFFWRNLLVSVIGIGSGVAAVSLIAPQVQQLWILPVAVPVNTLLGISAAVVLVCVLLVTRFSRARA